uniref:CSON000407 protein n=1 Tax=Culicoides sonorensis TaxID=179676 RepID=A0A336KA75_CULSO
MSGARVKTKRSPMKALPTLPIIINTSNLLPINYASITPSFSSTFSPSTRHISPEHAGGPIAYKGKVINQTENCIRRTASLDALTVVNNYSNTPNPCLFWQLDKATQTDESCFGDRPPLITDTLDAESPSEKMEKIIKHRMQRHNYRSACEHSVSSQTLSPMHVKASPVLIPPRTNQPIHMRPMRSSVEGLNQEIEKLVLHPSAGPMHSCRQELEMFSRGTPEGHRAPITDLFHPVGEHSRSTQTPLLSSDSQSTSPVSEFTINQAFPFNKIKIKV